MADDSYRTIRERTSVSFEVRGSTFIGHIVPVETVDAAESFIAEIETAYDDATHNVPAYRVRADPFREWASDDGEPTGSAGKPALNVLQGQELENVAVVVTRYFGGTKLGIGGLVRSYSRAVNEAVDRAGIVERRPRERFTIVVEYDDAGTVRGILESERSAGVTFTATYDVDVRFEVVVPAAEEAALWNRLQGATSGRVRRGSRVE